MSNARTYFRSVVAAAVLLGTLTACGDDGVNDPDPIAGTYAATTFLVTPPSGSAVNVLAAGGNLSIIVGGNGTTTGTLNVPSVVTGGAALQASMEGTVERNGNSVSFEQSADTFVRDLNWTVAGNTISVTNQSVAGAIYTIVLTR